MKILLLCFGSLFCLSSGPVSAQSVVDLGLATIGQPHGYASGDLVAFAASEARQGADLSGDGTLDDDVLCVHRVSSGATTNTGLPLPATSPLPIVLGSRLCAVPVSEAAIGPNGADRNGDGDATDAVLAVHDAATGITANLGLAAYMPGNVLGNVSVEGEHVLFGVPEWLQGADLDGDGDDFDIVLHSWRAGAATSTNLGLALSLSPTALALGPRHALFLVSEASQGADLNADGDMLDGVVHALSLASGVVRNLGLAAYDVRGDGDLFAFSLREPDQGFADFDGDGAANDTVLFAYLAPTGTVRNLGRSVHSSSSGPRYDVRGFVIAWSSDENQAGAGTDWNGDGDTGDSVLFTHNARSNATRNSGLAVDFPGASGFRFAISERLVGTSVSEILQGGTDLNGDGDLSERVAMVFDSGSGGVTNLGIAALTSPSSFTVSRELFAFCVDEFSQGQDLNGDGRLGVVVAAYRFATGATTILLAPPANILDVHAAGPNVVYVADETPFEATSGVDRNGDGDLLDDVLTSWNSATGVETNLGLAVQAGVSIFRFETSRTAAVFAVDESGQGATDLNADGDATDAVVHVLRL